jgi:zinc/manganese transport system ATP-binding protein
MAGRLTAETGAIEIVGARRDQIAFMPQLAAIDRTVPITATDVLALGWWRHAGAARTIAGGFAGAAAAALETVGLGGFERRLVRSLSAGQLQRLLFARLLVQDATLIILDEPFNAMDARTVDDLVRLLARWHAEGRTVVCVLHDLDLVRTHFPLALLLARECVAWGPTAEALHPANLLRARAMVEAWSTGAGICARGAA